MNFSAAKLLTISAIGFAISSSAGAKIVGSHSNHLSKEITKSVRPHTVLIRSTGQNVNSVFHSSGRFVQIGRKRWQERGNDGAKFNFVEQSRDAWSVYLRDNSRGVNIQLDLHRKMIIYSDDKGQRFDLYQISRSGSKSTKTTRSNGRKYSCRQERNLRSKKGDVSSNIRFRVVGESDETQFKIYWLDYQGKRQFYKHVFAGQTYNQQTFLTHPWVVTAPKPGGGETCIAIYTPSRGGQTITLR